MDMRDLPECAAGAAGGKPDRGGTPSRRRAQPEVRPGCNSGEYPESALEQYKQAIYEHLTREMHFSAAVAAGLMKDYEPFIPEFFADDYSVAMAAAYMAHNY